MPRKVDYMAVIERLMRAVRAMGREPCVILVNPTVSDDLLKRAREIAMLPTFQFKEPVVIKQDGKLMRTVFNTSVYVHAGVTDVSIVDDRGWAQFLTDLQWMKRLTEGI